MLGSVHLRAADLPLLALTPAGIDRWQVVVVVCWASLRASRLLLLLLLLVLLVFLLRSQIQSLER